MRYWIFSSGEGLELVHVAEAGFDCRLEHRAFTEIVKCGELQHIEIGLVRIVEVEHVGQRLPIVLRDVKQRAAGAARLVKVIESRIGYAGGSIQTWRS